MISFERILALLNDHDVRYVVVGGIAVVLHEELEKIDG